MHTFMRAWSETAADEKHLKELYGFKSKHNLNVDAILAQLQRRDRIHHQNVFKSLQYHRLKQLHTVVDAFYDPLLDHAALDLRAHQLATKDHLGTIHQNKIQHTENAMVKAHKEFMQHFIFYEWKDRAQQK